MTLATRCPACLTVFRVAPDQLRSADGWVRCGRCGGLFDTVQVLPAVVVAADTADAEAATPNEDPGAIGLQRPSRDDSPLVDPPAEELPDVAPIGVSSEPPTDADDDATGVTQPIAAAADEAAPVPPADTDGRDAAGAVEPEPPDDALPALVTPSPPPAADPLDELPPFARPDAVADARWRRPGVIRALAMGAGGIALGLAIAVVLQRRDLLAARWPAARPALEALCSAAGCRVEPLRRLADLAIESSMLTAAPSGAGLLLGVTVRNRGELPLALPWIRLVLTEVNGGPLARRALSPAELGATSATIAAAGEAALQATLPVDGPPPSGYTVELFYP